MEKNLRVSILGESITEWQRQALVNLSEKLNVEFSLVVGKIESDHPLDRRLHENLLNLPSVYAEYGWWPLVEIEKAIASQLGLLHEEQNLYERHETTELPVLSDAEYIEANIVEDGAWTEFSSETAQYVGERSDVAIRFGFGLLRGEILSAPEHGVLSFHPEDIRQYRGQGPEQTFINGDSYGGATLQQLDDTIDAGRIVAIDSTEVSDCYTLEQVWEQINLLQIELLTVGIENIADPSFDPWEPETLGEYNSHADRNRLQFVLKLLAKNQYGRLKLMINR